MTAASCPKKDFYTPPPPPGTPKNVQQTFVLHTQNSATFVLHTQKSRPKKGGKKVAKKPSKKVARKAAKKLAKNMPKKHTALYTTHMLINRKKTS